MKAEREAVRACLTRAGIVVKRKNGATDPTTHHIILDDLEAGILASVGPRSVLSGGEIIGAITKAQMALTSAGFKVTVDAWDTLVVVSHA